MKNIYRIEIPSKYSEGVVNMFWIGEHLELVPFPWQAVPCTEEESLLTMQRIDCVATCFIDNPVADKDPHDRYAASIVVGDENE